MATILVTGGAGYVGSHACKALAHAGHVPVTYDNLMRGHRELVKWGPLEVGDISDRARLDQVIARHRPAAVMHFAALTLVNESVAQPDLYHRNNVGGTTCLLEAMDAADVKAIVVSSSAGVYGVPTQVPVAETQACNPVNPYGETKLAMERMLARARGVSWIALRYFNAAGADPEGDTGEWHEPEQHLIPLMLDVALGRAGALIINGEDYPTPDGTCVRDYVHVTDLADAHVRALDFVFGGPRSIAINLGTTSGYSVRQVIETGRAVTGRKIPVTVGSRRAGDAPALVADARRAHEVLGWTPRRSDIATQIQDAWAWHQRLHRPEEATASNLPAV